MKIQFNLSEDLYLITEWDNQLLPKKGDYIKISDFMEKDYDNLFYNITASGSKTAKADFKSFKDLNNEENMIPTLKTKRDGTLSRVNTLSVKPISIKKEICWQRENGKLIAVFDLGMINKNQGITIGYL